MIRKIENEDFSGYVREQKRYTKNELKHIFSFDEAGWRSSSRVSKPMVCSRALRIVMLN